MAGGTQEQVAHGARFSSKIERKLLRNTAKTPAYYACIDQVALASSLLMCPEF